MTNEEQERRVAADVRSRVIADCASLLPLARSACAAMDEGDESEVLRLFCGESQKRTLRRLGRLIDDLRPLVRRKRGRSHGERDKTLHSVRAQVIAEMRRRKESTGLSWPKIVTALRNNSAYSARLRGKSDATWIRYAKSGFSG